MNKGMAIAGAVILGLSLLFVIGGGALSGAAGEDLENINDDPSPYYTLSENGSVTFTYVDEDKQGSAAFQVLIEMDYVDSDKDGYVDNCFDYNVEVEDDDGTNVTEDVINRGCVYDEYTDKDQMHDGLVIFVSVCETYYGDDKCILNSNYTVSVTDLDNESVEFTLFDTDAYMIMMLEEGLGAGGALAGGIGLISIGCCGIVIGLIILIIGFAVGDPQSQPQMMVGQMPMGGAMPANQGVVPMPAPVQSMQPPLSSGATDSSVPDMAAAYAEQFSQPPTE